MSWRGLEALLLLLTVAVSIVANESHTLIRLLRYADVVCCCSSGAQRRGVGRGMGAEGRVGCD